MSWMSGENPKVTRASNSTANVVPLCLYHRGVRFQLSTFNFQVSKWIPDIFIFSSSMSMACIGNMDLFNIISIAL